jgi:hypothetical protein
LIHPSILDDAIYSKCVEYVAHSGLIGDAPRVRTYQLPVTVQDDQNDTAGVYYTIVSLVLLNEELALCLLALLSYGIAAVMHRLEFVEIVGHVGHLFFLMFPIQDKTEACQHFSHGIRLIAVNFMKASLCY